MCNKRKGQVVFGEVLYPLCILALSLLLSACGGQEAIFSPENVQESAQSRTPDPKPERTPSPEPTFTPAPTAAPELTEEERLSLYIQNMSDAQKIGQLVMFGFEGNQAAEESFVCFMEEYNVGNLFLSSHNISDKMKDGGFSRCKEMLAALEQAKQSDIPLLISIDEEGGSVRRFGWEKKTPNAATLGKNNDEGAAYTQFAGIGRGLLLAGVQMNLAPCLDIAKNPSASWLHYRMISGDAEVATKIGLVCVEGLQSAGCMSVVKHFPGHGATNSNSHRGTPVVKKTLDMLLEYELLPFQAAVGAGVDGVMVTHISYPNIDAEHISSMSPVLIDEILRGHMGFGGLVLSDDFLMAGLTTKYKADEAAVQFILAGGDIILCGSRLKMQKQIMDALRAAVENGTISQERLNESVARILRAKIKYLELDI